MITRLNWCIWTCILVLRWIRSMQQVLVSNHQRPQVVRKSMCGHPSRTILTTDRWGIPRCRSSNRMSTIMVTTKRPISTNSNPWWGRQHLIITKIASTRATTRQVQRNLCNWIITHLHSSIKKAKIHRTTRHKRKCLMEQDKDAWCNRGATLTRNITTMTQIVAISEVSTRSKTNTENRGEKVATITP